MATYKSKRSVTLTVSEWQELICALYDARDHNLGKNLPFTATSIDDLRKAINAQIEPALESAAANTSKYLGRNL